MKKDILLAVISEVIERGGSISIHMPQYTGPTFTPVTKEEAFTMAQIVSDALGGEEITERDNSTIKVGGFTVERGKYDVWFSASYVNHMEEDVQLDGSDFDDREAL